MNKEDKKQLIQNLAEQIQKYQHFYVTDISGLNAAKTANLRRNCFEKDVKLIMVKNTLFIKALSLAGINNDEIVATLKGSSSIMLTNTGNLPAKLIKEFRKKERCDKPSLKAAFVEEGAYVGENQLAVLEFIKSKDELVGDIIGLLQSPAKNVIAALQGAAGDKVAGIVKTLQQRNN